MILAHRHRLPFSACSANFRIIQGKRGNLKAGAVLIGFSRLRLHSRDRNCIDNILCLTPTGKVVARTVEALEDGADGGAAG